MQDESSETHSSGNMSFWHHLAELRNTLLRIAIVLIVLAVLFFILMPYIFD